MALVVLEEARYGIATAVLGLWPCHQRSRVRAHRRRDCRERTGIRIADADNRDQLEARQGQYETAMILGAVLVTLVLTVNAIVIRLGDQGVQR